MLLFRQIYYWNRSGTGAVSASLREWVKLVLRGRRSHVIMPGLQGIKCLLHPSSGMGKGKASPPAWHCHHPDGFQASSPCSSASLLPGAELRNAGKQPKRCRSAALKALFRVPAAASDGNVALKAGNIKSSTGKEEKLQTNC